MIGYVRQAKIVRGPQQLNNSAAAPEGGARGRKSEPAKILSEEQDGERLDLGTACTPSRADPAWRPWEKSTGAKSEAVKTKVTRNAYNGGSGRLLRGLSPALREQNPRLAE